ncbi:MAG TPA: hypothetical protein PLD12_11980 [Bacteroidales bacterium]|nr:hypothetical protein [Bacteroidales bacterium]HPO66655.1 hypothetical protein [Bacteroidales bacterium]
MVTCTIINLVAIAYSALFSGLLRSGIVLITDKTSCRAPLFHILTPACRPPLSYKGEGTGKGGHLIATKRATPTGLEELKFLGSSPPKDRLILNLALPYQPPLSLQRRGEGGED